MADISHYGGLVAGNAMANPLDVGFDIITTTTHKSLRGPRGGMIICRQALARKIDASVFPGTQGGPHMNQVAAVAFALQKAGEEDFRRYCKQILHNAKALAQQLMQQGVSLVCNGTENHMLVINVVESFGINGCEAQDVLDRIGITGNKQLIPDDPLPPFKASGIRIGTPAATTRGMNEDDMRKIADWIVAALGNRNDADYLTALHEKIRHFCLQYPVPGLN
jgi:glycine hydroxymethyltransferase